MLALPVENKMVLFGSKFWVSRTVRTLTIAVLGPIATETRRHPFSIPRRPFISNHVSLASCLIVVLTAHLYATAFFVCNRPILSLSPRLPFICTHVFSRFSFDCCMGTVWLLVLWICGKSAIWAGASLSCGYVWTGVSYSCAYVMDPEPSQSLTTPTSLCPCHFDSHSHFSSPFFVLETQNLEPNRTKKTGTALPLSQYDAVLAQW